MIVKFYRVKEGDLSSELSHGLNRHSDYIEHQQELLMIEMRRRKQIEEAQSWTMGLVIVLGLALLLTVIINITTTIRGTP